MLRRSQAPVIASHSSARHFTPGWQRNLSDMLIQQLAAANGVIMISFGSSFLRNNYRDESVAISQQVESSLNANNISPRSREGFLRREEARKSQPVGNLQDLVDHIDHVVQLVGIDHVGLGSDFDGVMALPAGAQDVSMYPNIVAELLVRGYSDEDIGKNPRRERAACLEGRGNRRRRTYRAASRYPPTGSGRVSGEDRIRYVADYCLLRYPFLAQCVTVPNGHRTILQ